MQEQDKKECHLELMDMIIEQICLAPLSLAPLIQVAQYVKDDFTKFKNETHTSTEKFDFINENSKLNSGNISTFVKELCSLEKYYLRPSNI